MPIAFRFSAVLMMGLIHQQQLCAAKRADGRYPVAAAQVISFNPSIANVFYRAGYIEAWGRGIQKFFKSCNELGSPVPEYKKLGDDLTVKFVAAKVEHSQSSKSPKHQNEALDFWSFGKQNYCGNKKIRR